MNFPSKKEIKEEIQEVAIKEDVKEIELTIHEVETTSVIVNIDGWRMRVYFAENTVISKPNVGQKIKVKYTGNIKEVHTVKFKKLS